MRFIALCRGALSSAGQLRRRVHRALTQAREQEPLEFEQILVRFMVGTVITAYSLGLHFLASSVTHMCTPLIVVFSIAWIVAFGLLVHIALWTHRTLERRMVSIFIDAFGISGFLHFGGSAAMVFFPVYLWVTLGNGFRFGLNYMYGSMGANAFGFALMAALTPYWRDQWYFPTGVLLANIAIPLYVAKLIRNLREAMDEAKSASRAKTDFLSMISHELRTPLNAILGLAQLSKIGAASAQEQNNAASTELAASRLLRMVDSILKFQRIENGAAEVVERAFDPLAMLNEIRAIIDPLANQKGLDFHIRFLTPLPPTVLGDADHIQTIVLNLVTNAIKYTKQGRVALEVGLTGSPQNGVLRVNIRDTGVGIAPADQDRIFTRFVRAVDHNTCEESGVGLGLSTCKSLVALLGGDIGCESTPGKGSLFWAELPVSMSPSGGTEQAPAPAVPPPRVLFFPPAAFTAELAATSAGMHPVSTDSLGAMAEEPETFQRHVLVIDEDALSPSLVAGVRELLNGQPRQPALVVIRTDGALDDENFPQAAALLHRHALSALAGCIRTVVRWQKTVSMEATASTQVPATPCRKLNILVADDNDLNTDVMRRMLELDGHIASIVATGDAALDHLMRGNFDIALLDVNMPRLSGIDACKIYRSGLGGATTTPIVAITADASNATRERCLTAGMAGVLTKPVTLDQLRRMLAAHSGAPPANAQAEPAAKAAQAPIEAVAQTPEPPTPYGPAPPVAPEDGPPVFNDRQISQLLEVFGRQVFEEQFLKSFKSDVLRNMEHLRQAMTKGKPQPIRDALHAIKSSANTAGAGRLAATAAEYEHSTLENPPADLADLLQAEYSTYVLHFASAADRLTAMTPAAAAPHLPQVRPAPAAAHTPEPAAEAETDAAPTRKLS